MMNFELISREEINNLPADPEDCFVEYETIVRSRMTELISEDTRGDFDRAVQLQYMAAVLSIAEECGIKGIRQGPINEEKFFADFGNFQLAVLGAVNRILVRNRRTNRDPYSVLLTGNTRTKIEHYISRLRDIIETSDLSASRKKALGDRLDQLMAELGNRRLGYAKTMAILSAVLVGLGSLTTIAAEGPAAVTNIMKLIAIDKESEEAAALRLAPPQKALPAPPTATKPLIVAQGGPIWGTAQTSGGDLDDEIPF